MKLAPFSPPSWMINYIDLGDGFHLLMTLIPYVVAFWISRRGCIYRGIWGVDLHRVSDIYYRVATYKIEKAMFVSKTAAVQTIAVSCNREAATRRATWRRRIDPKCLSLGTTMRSNMYIYQSLLGLNQVNSPRSALMDSKRAWSTKPANHHCDFWQKQTRRGANEEENSRSLISKYNPQFAR